MPANCGVTTVFRATQVSPLRWAAASCGVATVIRAVMDVGAPFMTPGAGTARPVRGIVRGGVRGVSGQLRRCDGFPGDTSVAPTFGGGIPRRCVGRRAVMDVGAPFMTPGAGTARPVRGIARGGVRDVSGQLRRCVGYPGDTSVAPTFGGGIPRRCVGWRAVMDVGAPFMTPGAGTARPVRGVARGGVRGDAGQLRRCVGCSGDTSVAPTFWRRHPAALRRFSGRHKCRPYVLAACVAATLSADALKL